MTKLQIKEYLEKDCALQTHSLADYEVPQPPRWCKGCGDLGILNSIQTVLRDENIDPENVVCVSGIGCSSRLPHYINTYGFHGIHGRALPLATGVTLARPDLHVFVTMGDGDCFSIGGNHWLHTMRYNINATVMVHDNAVYALTKKQASPTTPIGRHTNTTPTGAFLKPLNPMSAVMGMSNISFVAQTATWLPVHLEATIRMAFKHKGLSFVRILQRCPAYMPKEFGEGGLKYPMLFLQNPEGIPVDPDDLALGTGKQHDHRDIHEAQRAAAVETPAPIGLLYWNPDLPTYNDVRYGRIKRLDRKGLLKRLEAELDKYAVKRN